MQLSKHFRIDEFLRSGTAINLKIDNSLPSNLSFNLRRLVNLMEEVRKCCGNHPIYITSGYRCEALNQAVGGSASSSHKLALACDFDFGGEVLLIDAVNAIFASKIEFDQLIIYDYHLHISTGGYLRRQYIDSRTRSKTINEQSL